ncbi:hypothetical protein, partial [Glutamicibacter sp. MNS18]|uniref:hypothetical protein n=1 Tax=Glutamicibacter sp. MNS18 TaxID=2989817 RepID=UPI002235D3D6
KAIGNPSENKGETNEVPANNNQTLGTTHGGASSQAKCYVFTKYKTFGINKLGTLLSSQTTNTFRFRHPRSSRAGFVRRLIQFILKNSRKSNHCFVI